MADDINIISIGGTPAVPWATEKTMSSLLNRATESATYLKAIARHAGASDAELNNLTSATSALGDTASDLLDETKKSTRVWGDRLDKGLKDIRSGLETALRFKSEDIAGPFEAAGISLKSLSEKLEDSKPKWSKFLGIASTGTAIFATLIGRLQETNTMMIGLASNGLFVQNGFAGLAKAADASGIRFSELAELLNKNANVAVALGTKRTVDLSKRFAELTNNGSDLLMSSKASQEALFDALDTAQTLGVLRNRSDGDVVKSSKDYLVYLNDLAEATGKNRDELRKQAQAAAKTTKTFLGVNALPKELRQAAMKTIPTLQAQFGESGTAMFDNLTRMMTLGVGAMDKEFQYLFSGVGGQTGDALKNMADALSKGDIEGVNKAASAFGDSLENLTEEQSKNLLIMERSNPQFAALVANARMANIASKERRDRIEQEIAQEAAEKKISIEEARKQRTERDNKEKQALADRTKAFNKASAAIARLEATLYRAIDALAPVLIPTIEALTDTFEFLLGTIKSVASTIKGVFGGGKGGGVAAVISTAAILVILKTVMGALLSGSMLKGVAGKAFGALKLPKFGKLGMPGAAASAAGGAGGSMLGALGSGIGAGLGGFLKALGSPQALLGIAVVSAGIIAIATAIRIAGPELENFGKMMQMVFEGMTVPIKAVGEIIINWWQKLKEVIDAVGDNIVKVVESFSKFRTAGIEATTNQIKDLSAIPGDSIMASAKGITALKEALDGFSPGTLTGFNQFIGGFFASDPVEKLQKLARIGNDLGSAAGNIEKFKTALAPLIGQGPITAASSAPSSPVITTDQLNIRTLKYYDDSIIKLSQMVDKLDILHDDMDRMRLSSDVSFEKMVDAYNRTRQNIN